MPNKKKDRYLFVAFFILFLLLFVLLFVFLFLRSKTKYNVVLISIDSLRADHMSLYGYDRKTTPGIDDWAKNAFVSNNYFSTAYLTPVSEASVHTGFYPQGHQVINFESSLDKNKLTIAEILKSQGYQTAAFGSSPEFSPDTPIGKSFSRGFDTYNIDNFRHKTLPNINTIKNWLSGKKNFFIWIPIGAVHFNYGSVPDHFVDESYAGKLKGDSLGYYTLGFIFKDKIYRNSDALVNSSVLKTTPTIKVENTLDLTKSDKDYIISKYDDGIFYVDNFLSQLFSYLKESGLEKNTIVIFQSEHGEDLDEHGTFMHYDIWDTNTKLPLVIKLPGTKAVSDDQLISGVDLFSTLMDLLNLKYEKNDGLSFASAVGGISANRRSEVFISRVPLWERLGIIHAFVPYAQAVINDEKKGILEDFAIRNDRWKLIHRTARDAIKKYSWYSFVSKEVITPDEWELYDLSVDPLEQKNVFKLNKDSFEIQDLMEKLTNFETEANSRLKLIPQSPR